MAEVVGDQLAFGAMSAADGWGIAGGVVTIGGYARSSYRRWRDGIEHDSEHAVKDLRDEVMPMLNELVTTSRTVSLELGNLRERVAVVETQLRARLRPPGKRRTGH